MKTILLVFLVMGILINGAVSAEQKSQAGEFMVAKIWSSSALKMFDENTYEFYVETNKEGELVRFWKCFEGNSGCGSYSLSEVKATVKGDSINGGVVIIESHIPVAGQTKILTIYTKENFNAKTGGAVYIRYLKWAGASITEGVSLEFATAEFFVEKYKDGNWYLYKEEFDMAKWDTKKLYVNRLRVEGKVNTTLSKIRSGGISGFSSWWEEE